MSAGALVECGQPVGRTHASEVDEAEPEGVDSLQDADGYSLRVDVDNLHVSGICNAGGVNTHQRASDCYQAIHGVHSSLGM